MNTNENAGAEKNEEANVEELLKANQEFEKFYKDLSPLLEKLEAAPELVSLIKEKDSAALKELAESVAKGQVSKEEAATVAAAEAEVKKEVGEKKYESMDPAAIERLITAKLSEGFKSLETKVEKVAETQGFQSRVNTILTDMEDLPDVEKYADRIQELATEHPELKENVKALYQMAKGEEAIAKLSEKSKAEEAEAMKQAIGKYMPTPVGYSKQGVPIYDDKRLADRLIGDNRSLVSYL